MSTAGQFRTYRDAVGMGRVGISDGLSDVAIEGNNYTVGKGGLGALSPLYYLPRGDAARYNSWFMSNDPIGLVARGSASADGTTEWFNTLTNSGTIALNSAVVGYQGCPILTTGATSTNQVSCVATPSFFPTTGRIAVMMGRFYFPDPVSSAYAFHFGFGNKQVAPDATAFTDGAWIEGTHSGTTLTLVGRTREASGTASSTATLATVTTGAPKSIEFAVVLIGNTRVDFFTRLPATATNLWVKTTYSSTEIPADTVLMRPHLAITTKAAATRALSVRDVAYWFERSNVLP